MAKLPQRPINVLLLLSFQEQPPPDEEMVALHDECRSKGEAYFATTRNISALDRGSEVAFYADGQEGGRLMATAEFCEFTRFDSVAGAKILEEHKLYGSGHPARIRGFIRLRHLELARQRAAISSLNGVVASRRILTSATILDMGTAASVYYVKAANGDAVTDAEVITLLAAKCAELEDKYRDTRSRWEADRSKARELSERIRDLGELHQELQSRSPRVTGFGGRHKHVRSLGEGLLASVLPNIRLLKDSLEMVIENYYRSRKLMDDLRSLNDDPLLRLRRTTAKALQGVKGWFEIRFGDNLGRLYYRSCVGEGNPFVEVLISHKDEQTKDIRYLQARP